MIIINSDDEERKKLFHIHDFCVLPRFFVEINFVLEKQKKHKYDKKIHFMHYADNRFCYCPSAKRNCDFQC